MRTTMLVLAAVAAALSACKWTEFDDLQNDTWVGSTEKPGVKSSDYGVAIQRGKTLTAGGTLVVIGADPPLYSALTYDAEGGAKLAAGTLDLNNQFGIGMLESQPIVLAHPDPASDEIALLVNGGGSQVLGLVGTDQLDRHDLFVTPSVVDAATYMQPPPRFDTHVAQPARPLVASGDNVLGVFTSPEPAVDAMSMHVRCKLVDASGGAITPRGLGAARVSNTMVDDVIAWGSGGKLYRYKGDVFNGCPPSPFPAQPPLATHETGFVPGRGSQILSIDATHVLLQGHRDTEDASMLQVYDASTLAPVGSSASTPKLRTAAILNTGTQQYVIAGYPGDVADKTTGGVVRLFKVSAAGIESEPAAVLHDAQPESGKSFGRAVAAIPFNGKQIVVVAANNEIFAYFRLNLSDGTPLYSETRQGR